MTTLRARQDAVGARWQTRVGQHWESLALFLGFLILYIATLSPDILPADSGEFQVVVPLLGVAHPPGFSLYILLGKLFMTLVPVGTAAYRLNLFSAVMSALTLMFVNLAVRRILGAKGRADWLKRIPGVLAAILLGVSTTFWSQATTANIRSLMALLTAVVVYALVGYRLTSTPNRAAFLVGALSLAVVHHLSIAFIAAVLGIAIFFLGDVHRFALRDWGKIVIAGLIPLLVLLYLPIRGAAGAYLAPPGLTTVSGFLQHVLGLGFGGDFFYFAQWSAFPDRLAILFNIFEFQFNDFAIGLLALGLILCFCEDWKLALVLAVGFGVHCFIAITYRAPQTVEYLLPAYVLLVVAAGIGLGWISDFKFQILDFISPTFRLAPEIAAQLLWLGTAGLIFARNLPAYQYLAQDKSTRQYAESLRETAPDNAIILSDWNYATPMWYLQNIEGLRSDLDVQYVFPEGLSLAQNWLDRLKANVSSKPTIVTDFYPQEYAETSYRFIPTGPAWEVVAQPLTQAPAYFNQMNEIHDQGWAVVGTYIPGRSPWVEFDQGQSVSMLVAWKAPAKPTDINFFVQLIGEDGQLYAQGDVSHLATQIAPNEVIVDRFTLTPNLNAPVDRESILSRKYSIVTGAYLPDGTRLAPDFTQIGQATINPSEAPLASANPIVGSPLTGYDYDLSVPDSPRLYLHWRGSHKFSIFVGNTLLQESSIAALGVALDVNPDAVETKYATTVLDLQPNQWPLRISENSSSSGILPWSYTIPAPSPNARYISFGPLTLVGSIITKESDGSYSVDLDWLANRPITDDLIVKVDMVGENYAWRDQSDAVPAGGAIPTLKWIPGIVIHDRHRLTPQQATPATFQLAVYDHFTQRNLPILDERLAQLGPTVTVGAVQP